MYRFILFIVIALTTFNYAQLNVDLISNLNQYPSVRYSDIWGYTDPSGNEYALLGVRSGTSIISLINPTNPVEVAFIPGPLSTWRELKTHSHYAYVVTEGSGSGSGMQIIDLSQLPNSATLVNTYTTTFTTAHNILIDDGFAYVVGTAGGGGMHILNLANPVNPVQTSYFGSIGYIHDVYVWNDSVIACAGNSQNFQIINVNNKSNPQLVSESPVLPGIYAHSGWMTEDKRYFIGTDEFDVRDIMVFDLQDRSSWDVVVPQWQMTNPTPATDDPAHNLYIRGDFAHISYYKHGYVVLDVSNPNSPQLVGNYDTYPSNTGVYNGAWGVYPFLPSGNILISDMQTGLWVFDFTLDEITPVELSSFTASISANAVNIEWSTITELNNQGFEIQRSVNKENWTSIGYIDGAGSTSERKSYSFLDKNPIEGKSFYRLEQIDFDGTRKSYDAVEVDFHKLSSFTMDQNYPNPFNPSTKINFTLLSDAFTSLTIYNTLGEKVSELVNEYLTQGNYDFDFNATSLPSGLYFAQLISGSNIKSIKMTLLK